MNNCNAMAVVQSVWGMAYEEVTTSKMEKNQVYTKKDFLKEFCGDMSMETLQQILREHAPEYLI